MINWNVDIMQVLSTLLYYIVMEELTFVVNGYKDERNFLDPSRTNFYIQASLSRKEKSVLAYACTIICTPHL